MSQEERRPVQQVAAGSVRGGVSIPPQGKERTLQPFHWGHVHLSLLAAPGESGRSLPTSGPGVPGSTGTMWAESALCKCFGPEVSGFKKYICTCTASDPGDTRPNTELTRASDPALCSTFTVSV